MKYLVLAGVMAIAVGCGAGPVDKPVAAPKPSPPPAKPAAAPSRPPVATPDTVAADAFANPAEAVTALVLAVSESNSEDYARAQSWLLLQKATAIPAVADLVRDEQAPMFARTNGCKMLPQLGPEAAEVLLELSQADTPRVRQVAIEELGNVRPATPQAIDSLIELTQAADNEIRLAAVLPPATKAAETMVAILNNTSEPEPLRSAAKQCLTKVNPRKTFND